MNTKDWSPLRWTSWIFFLTLKSLLQHHRSKASILWHSAFFTVQLSHPYMTTGKTIALTRQTFVGKVISLLFNMLSRLVITFLPTTSNAEEAEVEWFYEDLQDLLEITPKKDVLFIYRGLECKSRKSRNTLNNWQIWSWSTE